MARRQSRKNVVNTFLGAMDAAACNAAIKKVFQTFLSRNSITVTIKFVLEKIHDGQAVRKRSRRPAHFFEQKGEGPLGPFASFRPRRLDWEDLPAFLSPAHLCGAFVSVRAARQTEREAARAVMQHELFSRKKFGCRKGTREKNAFVRG